MEGLFPVDPWLMAAAFVVTLVASTLQGTIGFGFALTSVPVLSLLDPALAPVPQLLVVLPLTVTMAWRERRDVDLKGVGWVLLGRIPGAGMGLLLLKLADGWVLDVILATMVLTAVLILASGKTVRRTRATELVAGAASSTFGLVSSIGGPPLALLYRDEKGATIRASLAAIFTIGLLMTITVRIVADEMSWRDAHVAVWLVPALFLGFVVSRFLSKRVEGRPLRIAILVVSAGCALGLLARAALTAG